jgi:hypothetical protein
MHSVTRVERSREVTPERQVKTFCQTMIHPDAPRVVRQEFINLIQGWGVLSSIPETFDINDYNQVQQCRFAAIRTIESGTSVGSGFLQRPWNYDFSLQGEYGDDELEGLFPTALQLKSILPENLKFHFRIMPASQSVRLVERENGKIQVVRITQTERSIANK